MTNQSLSELFKTELNRVFDINKSQLLNNSPEFIKNIRIKAFNDFNIQGFPSSKHEDWRFTNLNPIYSKSYNQYFENIETNIEIDDIFQCDVADLDTYVVTQLNGWIAYKNSLLTVMDNGIIIGSLLKATEDYPELIEQYYSKKSENVDNCFDTINTMFSKDGVFIYVPDNVELEKPIQIINIVNTNENILIQPRNLIIVGKNSKLQIVQCEHSLTNNVSFINSVTEVFQHEGSELDFYNIQNKGKTSTLITNSNFELAKGSTLNSNTITLNGAFTRNNLRININGEDVHANAYGLYLVDDTQLVDNNTYIDHKVPNSHSNELYKGIIDDNASAVFYGRAMVRKDAQKTTAYQTNKNILLTDDAKINTQPHLEIYADDVKCGHGATVGQLDNEALFYLRSRGIGQKEANILLMYAFAAEIINKINIEALQERIDHLVSKRLKGELTICDQCVMHCKSKKSVTFNIDKTKL